MARNCPEILDTFWELVKYHSFVILMQELSELSQYISMYVYFIVQKISRSIGKMKLCGLYHPEIWLK